MLVLSRKVTDSIRFPELDITVEILKVKGSNVRVGIDAPIEINVLRGEIEESEHRPITKKILVAADNEHQQRNKLNELSLAVSLTKKMLQRGMHQAAASKLEEALSRLNSDDYTSGSAAESIQITNDAESQKGLLVEDVANEREMLAGFLKLHGFEVETAKDGLDAIDFLENSEKPDFILMDMNLPRLHGAETVRQIRANSAFDQVHIFAVSGVAPESLGFDVNRNRVTEWFQKPVRPVALINSIHSCVATTKRALADQVAH